MPTFKVRVIANNEAGEWASWPAKIAAVKDFYAPVCNLDITFEKTALTPKFALYGESGVYQVDETWYEDNIAVTRQDEAFLVFVVPPTDHPNITTLGGIETGHAQGPWETTVFTDETSDNYVDTVDQGNNCVIIICHELSHAFYALLSGVNGGAEDSTHLYFYAGTPDKVLADFVFTSNLTTLYQKLISALQALYQAKKKS
jgi:hypothetical protein